MILSTVDKGELPRMKTKIQITLPAELKRDVDFLRDKLSSRIKEHIDLKTIYRFGTNPTNADLRRGNEIIEGIFWLLNDIDCTGIYADGKLVHIAYPEEEV